MRGRSNRGQALLVLVLPSGLSWPLCLMRERLLASRIRPRCQIWMVA